MASIGSLGFVEFLPGTYVYVGSAMNSLGARIKRHLGKDKKIFWHIDYFLDSDGVKIEKVLYKESNKKQECEIARSIKGNPVKNFGSSDCDCKSHLFRVPNNSFENQRGFKTWESS